MPNKKRGLTIGLTNQKGGVGKSSTATALATVYAMMGYRVLLVDNDPQGNATLQVGVNLADQEIDLDGNKPTGTVIDLYLERGTYEGAVVQSPVLADLGIGLDLIPATVELAEVEMNLVSKPGADMRLRRALEPAREVYDLIILDSPPNLGKLSTNVLTASDYILIPVGSLWALRSVKALLKAMVRNNSYYGVSTVMAGIVLTMVDKTLVMNQLREVVGEAFESQLLKAEIRKSTTAPQAEAAACPVPAYAPRTGLALDYGAVALELLSERIGSHVLDTFGIVARETVKGGK
jgi:chromosome partitioning protein